MHCTAVELAYPAAVRLRPVEGIYHSHQRDASKLLKTDRDGGSRLEPTTRIYVTPENELRTACARLRRGMTKSNVSPEEVKSAWFVLTSTVEAPTSRMREELMHVNIPWCTRVAGVVVVSKLHICTPTARARAEK